MISFIRLKNTPFGGAENYLKRLTHVLSNKEIDFDIIHSSVPKFLPSWFKALYFNVEACFKKRDIYFSLERISCADIYRAGDGVHRVFIESKKLQTNKISFNPLNWVYCYLEEKCFNHCQHIIANSEMIKKQIINTYHIDSQKISVIYNGIDFPEYNEIEEKQSILNEFNIHHTTRILLFVGSGFKRKGVEEFLHIISDIKTADWVGFVVGKEKKLANYQKLARKLGIHNKVIFTGPRTDVHRFYIAGDIFVFPTHYEPFSNVVLEALYYKNVVFTTDQNGASEILKSEFVFDFNRLNTVSKKIDELFLSSTQLEKLKNNNAELAKQFSIEKNVDQTLSVIDKVFPNSFTQEK